MRAAVVGALCVLTAPLASQAPGTPGIEDNSFLIEEAYNQDAGVVQHITTWQRSVVTAAWNFSFTQEWPLLSQRHQGSYTLLLGSSRTGAEFGGVALNYRYQLLPADDRIAIAPRASVLIPSHRDHLGAQLELPVSVRISAAFVAHANAGVAATTRATTLSNLGASVVWLARPTVNVLCELTWNDEDGARVVLLNPGVRWAYNLSSGLQIVPGLAYTVGLGPSAGAEAAFIYLSFEHPFGGAAPEP